MEERPFSPELLVADKPVVIMDFGKRRPQYHENRPVRNVVATNDSYTFVPLFEGEEVDLSRYDPQKTLIIAATSTADIKKHEEAGFRVYPSSEYNRHISNKWELYEWCREENVPTTLTLRLPSVAQKDTELHSKLGRLRQAFEEIVLKPEQSYSPVRDAIEPVSKSSEGEVLPYLESVAPHAIDLDIQKEIAGMSKKVFGAWPDQWYYLDEDDSVKVCPPNIIRTCNRLSEQHNFPFGGIDFMDNNGVWELIDMNPPGGGRRLPTEAAHQALSQAMNERVDDLLQGAEVPKRNHLIKVIVAAAGEGRRLHSLTQGEPKSLLPVGGNKRVVDYAVDLGKTITQEKGYADGVMLLTLPEHTGTFSKWKNETQKLQVEIINPDPALYEEASSYNHLLAAAPKETDLLFYLSADRIIEMPQETIKEIAVQVRQAFNDGIPYISIGVEDSHSKHRFETDAHGRILHYSKETQKGIGVKKIGFAFDMAKVTAIKARNTFDVVDQMTGVGVLGRLLLVSHEISMHDIDTPDDLTRARDDLSY